MDLLTIGHSNRSIDDFLGLLAAHSIGRVADVRAMPASRRLPHFAKDPLSAALGEAGIDYVHLPELGGRRRPAPDSPNRGWRVEAFRGYADHMASEEFAAGLDRLELVARKRRTAAMCAEALWWRCHRRLIADALMARRWRVLHVLGEGPPRPHELTGFAMVEGGSLSYPSPQAELDI